MYESPIDLLMSNIQTQIIEQQEEAIYKAVFDIGVNVTKDELIRALQYDRDQYHKGYADGKRDAMEELVRCKECKYYKQSGCQMSMRDFNLEDDFCSYGERREGE